MDRAAADVAWDGSAADTAGSAAVKSESSLAATSAGVRTGARRI